MLRGDSVHKHHPILARRIYSTSHMEVTHLRDVSFYFKVPCAALGGEPQEMHIPCNASKVYPCREKIQSIIENVCNLLSTMLLPRSGSPQLIAKSYHIPQHQQHLERRHFPSHETESRTGLLSLHESQSYVCYIVVPMGYNLQLFAISVLRPWMIVFEYLLVDIDGFGRY